MTRHTHTPSPTANAQDVRAKLTDAERETLNAAAVILQQRSTRVTSWLICAGARTDGTQHVNVTYFDTNNDQHGSLAGATFADKVALAIETQHRVDANAEGYKARRVEQLKAELAALDVAA